MFWESQHLGSTHFRGKTTFPMQGFKLILFFNGKRFTCSRAQRDVEVGSTGVRRESNSKDEEHNSRLSEQQMHGQLRIAEKVIKVVGDSSTAYTTHQAAVAGANRILWDPEVNTRSVVSKPRVGAGLGKIE